MDSGYRIPSTRGQLERTRLGLAVRFKRAVFRLFELAAAVRPALLIVAEIPSRLSDAPCRFPFAFAYEAKRAGAAVCLINGWLYGEEPASRIDRLERSWFRR